MTINTIHALTEITKAATTLSFTLSVSIKKPCWYIFQVLIQAIQHLLLKKVYIIF